MIQYRDISQRTAFSLPLFSSVRVPAASFPLLGLSVISLRDFATYYTELPTEQTCS